MADKDLMLAQHEGRIANHPHSMKSKVPSGRWQYYPAIRPGDLVYLYRNKSRILSGVTALTRHLRCQTD